MLKIYHKHWVWLQFIQHQKHNMKQLFIILAFLLSLKSSHAQLFTKEKIKIHRKYR